MHCRDQPGDAAASGGSEAALRLVEGVPGWLTADQARVLHACARTPEAPATVVEIGSHHGRSTLVLAAAVAPHGRVVAIDPYDPRWRYGEAGVEAAMRGRLAAAGLTAVVDVRVSTSRAERTRWARDGARRVDLLYVDGAHDYRSLRHDLGWSRFVPAGGTVLVHDAFSSLGVTLGLLRTLLGRTDLAYVDRTGSLARLRVGRPSPAERLRPLRELPWFARNLVIKVLLRLGARSAAARLGHHGPDDPF